MQIAFLATPEVHLLDLSGPAHIFYEAAEHKPEISLHYISPDDNTELKTSSGLHFSHLSPFYSLELSKGDLLFLPGLESDLLLDPDFNRRLQPFYKWLRKQPLKGVSICSVCTGAFLLAESGLLDGKECTTHWKYLDVFKKKYPKVTLLGDRLFVESEAIYSSAGVSSGIDLVLFILEKFYGSFFAAQIAREVVIYHRRSENDPQLNIFLNFRNHQENRVHEVQNWLTKNLNAAGNIEEIAEQVHMSGRNLTRLFKKTTGITVGHYVEKLRLETATKLLEEGAKMDHIAAECGLKSTNQLRKILDKMS